MTSKEYYFYKDEWAKHLVEKFKDEKIYMADTVCRI